MYTTQNIKVKDISQYLDLNTKIKAISRNITKHLENFKISLTFLCSVSCDTVNPLTHTLCITAKWNAGPQSTFPPMVY